MKKMSTKEMSELTGLSPNTLKTFIRANQIKKVSIRRTPANQIEFLYDFRDIEAYARAKGWVPEEVTSKFDEPKISYAPPQPFTPDDPIETVFDDDDDVADDTCDIKPDEIETDGPQYRSEYLTLELLSAFREIFGDLGTRNILINNYGLTPEVE